jgi:two-component sensor histidine kinase
LPERLAERVPPVVVEVGIGLLLAGVALAFRASLTPLIGDIAPYALVFAAVTLASVLAGWRGGLVALVVGQLFTLLLIVEPVGSLALDPQRRWALIITTGSQLVLLMTIALYQREVDRGTAEREQRMDLLDEALKEIDHRTRNNYQTVLAMIDLQARRATEPNVTEALRQVADRIQAIANASQQLAVRSEELAAVRLDDHLCGLVQQIERGLSREEIEVGCEVDGVTASPDTATSISIIVNELVTNAIKHAFGGREGGRVYVFGRSGSPFELTVSDDGQGIQASRREGHSGLGSKLVESFARQLGAQHQVMSSEQGTTHRLLIPSLE